MGQWGQLWFRGGALWRVVESSIGSDDRAQIDATLDKALKTDMESYHLEFRLKHKKGHYVPVLSRGFIIRNSDGGILRISRYEYGFNRAQTI